RPFITPFGEAFVFCILRHTILAVLLGFTIVSPSWAQGTTPDKPAEPDPAKTAATVKDVSDAKDTATQSADVAWMLTATGLVLFMMPGLALFYGGMARRKNVLGTMMHTMIALGIVGVQWVVLGYALAFGETKNGMIGW